MCELGLIVSDLDGTLLGKYSAILPENAAAIRGGKVRLSARPAAWDDKSPVRYKTEPGFFYRMRFEICRALFQAIPAFA